MVSNTRRFSLKSFGRSSNVEDATGSGQAIAIVDSAEVVIFLACPWLGLANPNPNPGKKYLRVVSGQKSCE